MGPTATSLVIALISALTHFPMHSTMIETTNFGTLKRPLMTWHSIKKEKKIQHQGLNIKLFLVWTTDTSLVIALISALTHFPMHSTVIETTNLGTLKR